MTSEPPWSSFRGARRRSATSGRSSILEMVETDKPRGVPPLPVSVMSAARRQGAQMREPERETPHWPPPQPIMAPVASYPLTNRTIIQKIRFDKILLIRKS